MTGPNLRTARNPKASFLILVLVGAMPAAAQLPSDNDEIVVIGRKLGNVKIQYGSRMKNGVLHIQACRVKKSSGDADIDQIPCQAITDCAAQFGPSRPSQSEFDKCVKPRMNAMKQALADRRSGARDAP